MHNAKCYYASFDEGLPDQLISTLVKWFTMFQKVVGTSLLGACTPWSMSCLTLKTKTLWSFETLWITYSVTTHSGRFESSGTQLWEPQIKHSLLRAYGSRQTNIQCHIKKKWRLFSNFNVLSKPVYSRHK